MSEKASAMSSVQAAIETIAGPYRGNRKSWLAGVSRSVAGVSYRTVKALWYGEITNEEHLAAQAIKREATLKLQSAQREATLRQARQEARDLATRFETIAGGLNATDPDFHSADVAALVHASRILRGLDRA
jgi:hypothetical protein